MRFQDDNLKHLVEEELLKDVYNSQNADTLSELSMILANIKDEGNSLSKLSYEEISSANRQFRDFLEKEFI